MANDLQGKRIAFLATDGVEQVELTEPWKAIEEAGGEPELLSIKSGEIQGVDGMDKTDTFRVDRLVSKRTRPTTTASSSPGEAVHKGDVTAAALRRSTTVRGSSPDLSPSPGRTSRPSR